MLQPWPIPLMLFTAILNPACSSLSRRHLVIAAAAGSFHTKGVAMQCNCIIHATIIFSVGRIPSPPTKKFLLFTMIITYQLEHFTPPPVTGSLLRII